MKIEYRSRKRSHKLDGIGVGRNVSISSDSVYDSVAYDPVKTGLSESEAEAEDPTNRKARNRNTVIGLFFRFCLRLRQCSFHLIVSDGVMHKQNQCSASDSVGLIFTRSYRFTLLITTPTTTPSLVKTSLKRIMNNKPCPN